MLLFFPCFFVLASFLLQNPSEQDIQIALLTKLARKPIERREGVTYQLFKGLLSKYEIELPFSAEQSVVIWIKVAYDFGYMHVKMQETVYPNGGLLLTLEGYSKGQTFEDGLPSIG